MQDLTVIGVESGALIVAGDDGERFRLVVDEVLQSRLRQAVSSAEGSKKVSPREIQTHVRAGLSAFEVAELTGASVEYVERFEGPVVAERQFIVDSARRVPVQPTSPADPLGEEPLTTFGEALEERLESLDAQDVRWSSWKDETGWTVKLTFTSREIDHDARWQFDPKRHVLTPLNNEATTLSRHGELSEGLIPRLRAVVPSEAGDSRFDSGAFAPIDGTASEAPAPAASEAGQTSVPTTAATADTGPAVAPITIGGGRAKEQRPYDAFAVNRAPEADTADHNQTADLLEALRRRRGEREAANFGALDATDAAAEPEAPRSPAAEPVHPAFGGPRRAEEIVAGAEHAEPAELADTPLDGLDEAFGSLADEGSTPPPAAPAPAPAATPARAGGAKRQRAAMPSWDEIVFGARSEDDPA